MKYNLLIISMSLLFSRSYALEYIKQLENEKVSVSYVKIMPQEEIGLHYDEYPQVVVALEGGVLTRLEADGSTTEVEFPTGKAVFRPSETADKMHKSINATSMPIALIIVQLK
jgi:quercetin dioxygenase-like cupin family protein